MAEAMFVTAARVAAHLYFATKVAQNLSLTAKNARAITARAGQQAAGFTALTTFIQELADNTILVAQQVNKVAVSISCCATQLERVGQASAKFAQVQKLGSEAKYIDTIATGVSDTNKRKQKLSSTFAKLRFNLDELVEDTRKQIRFAAVISTMSKVEASNSGHFETQLEVIASNILKASMDIRKELECAESLLSTTIR